MPTASPRHAIPAAVSAEGEFPLAVTSIKHSVHRVTEDGHMAKNKDARSYVKLVSSESDHCYFVQKNRNNTKDRLQLRKYDPKVRKHVQYKEGK